MYNNTLIICVWRFNVFVQFLNFYYPFALKCFLCILTVSWIRCVDLNFDTIKKIVNFAFVNYKIYYV